MCCSLYVLLIRQMQTWATVPRRTAESVHNIANIWGLKAVVIWLHIFTISFRAKDNNFLCILMRKHCTTSGVCPAHVTILYFSSGFPFHNIQTVVLSFSSARAIKSLLDLYMTYGSCIQPFNFIVTFLRLFLISNNFSSLEVFTSINWEEVSVRILLARSNKSLL